MQRASDVRRRLEAFLANGDVDMIVFCWERRGRRDISVLACAGMNDGLEARVLQPEPTDEQSLILLAGPDAPYLRTVTATLLGAGALGGT